MMMGWRGASRFKEEEVFSLIFRDKLVNPGGYLNFLTQKVLNWYFWLLRSTVAIQDADLGTVRSLLGSGKAGVLATPHTILLPVVLAMRGMPATFLASQSRDGSLIAGVLQRQGFGVVRGSSSRGGVAGLAAMARALKPGQAVGLTFDGPKGPPLQAKKGIGLLAARAPESSFAVLVKFRPRFFGLWRGYVNLGSWDRFHLLLPFASLEIECVQLGTAVSGLKTEDFQIAALLELERLTQERYGALYTH